jgi:hypothetical protein
MKFSYTQYIYIKYKSNYLHLHHEDREGYAPPRRPLNFNGLHGVIAQKLQLVRQCFSIEAKVLFYIINLHGLGLNILYCSIKLKMCKLVAW